MIFPSFLLGVFCVYGIEAARLTRLGDDNSAARSTLSNELSEDYPGDVNLDELVKQLTDVQTVQPETTRGRLKLDQYNTWQQIYDWLEELANKQPNVVTLINIGVSWEGRPLVVVKVNRGGSTEKPAVWVDAGIHGDEWIGPATALFFIHALTQGSATNVPEAVDQFIWYIMPVFNVDGYDFTWTSNRLWRKTRSRHDDGSGCVGVDPNRNWDLHWAESGTSDDPCSHRYHGPFPFSEPEVRAVADFLRFHMDDIQMYVALHSFGQLWMTPYSYKKGVPTKDAKTLFTLANIGAKAAKKVNGTEFKVGPISKVIGIASGSSVDYTYEKLGIKYSFGIELPDEGQYGLLLPPDQILPSASSAWAGVVAMANEVLNLLDPRWKRRQ